jgi:DNA-binding transcriptional LysR family regulator
MMNVMTAQSLPHLETFVVAAEQGSFTAAARLLGVSQAAVSQRVQQIESILKRSLFRREAGRMALTDAGQSLLAFARRILKLHEDAIVELCGTPDAVAGELLLAASSVPGEHLLPPLLATFRRTYPKIRVRLTVADTAAVVRDVRLGRAHLGVVGGKEDRSRLAYRPIGKEKMVVAVPADHPWAMRRSIPLKALLQQPLLQREIGSASRKCFEDALCGAGHSPSELQVAMELGSNEAIKEALLRGVGVAVISANAVTKEATNGAIHLLNVKGLPLSREFYVVQDESRALPPSAQAFLVHCPAV